MIFYRVIFVPGHAGGRPSAFATALRRDKYGRALQGRPLRCYRDALIFQILLLPSSDTSRLPSAATVTPTGRPQRSSGTPPSPSLMMNPVMKSSSGPGFPFVIGKNATRYPDAIERFHEPCSATNAPLR